ncbi:hypothetical protein ABE237_13560 [Brevibacillus formosus]|uniref:hypothetical protein n=1 Tax=Brevibacillus TaxID=55080 RepID=UPI000D0F2006|nr:MULTISPECIES: hypothetical protein [Brevibacillus]MBG9945238.1 hypothetical protein [Brevibacillus formosus]MBW5467398.1 hypothetical protein [Brevibacillus formosus]MED1943592.1 hypothetical protein [Brevibacillus formosus]MED2000036.1 hypothetical protein [Brevibacillus formosus]MED2081827.1 hypothetical protein [Brevibacillus formosus]
MKKIALLLFAVFMIQLHFTSATFASGDRIRAGQALEHGAWLTSMNSKYQLSFSVYRVLRIEKTRSDTILWSVNTNGVGHSLKLDFYSGKLVLLRANGDPLWYSDNAAWSSSRHPAGTNLRGDLLIMQDDGNLVLYNTTDLNKGWYPVWASDTGVGGP